MNFNFFENFWQWVKKRFKQADDFETYSGIPQKIQQWEDIHRYNPLAIVNAKLTAKVCDEATFDIESDSKQAEPLKDLIKDIESKRYDICSMMNGKGGCFVTMAQDEKGEPYHIVVAPQNVSVYNISNNNITELAMVIDKKLYKKEWYNLVRHHILDASGTLSVYYYITGENGEERYFVEWEQYKDKSTAFLNANHIGVAYFKSPQNSRGLSPIFGVPLNFGCEETEQQIIKDRNALIKEMNHAEMKLFADKSIVRIERTKDGNAYNIPEDIYLIQKKGGIDGSLIDSFAPSTRYSDYESKLEKSYEDYENQIGLNKGFLSRAETTGNATATEIKTANIQTISFIKKIQSAMDYAIKETIKADGVFLNISEDLYSIKIDWFDIYEDYDKQYERIANAVDRGIAEKVDELQWLFPNLSIEELQEKLDRINEEKQQNLVKFNLANANETNENEETEEPEEKEEKEKGEV